jgi:hypothetical protein
MSHSNFSNTAEGYALPPPRATEFSATSSWVFETDSYHCDMSHYWMFINVFWFLHQSHSSVKRMSKHQKCWLKRSGLLKGVQFEVP